MADVVSLDRPVFRREGDYWTIVFAGRICRLRDSAGLRHLAHLLGRPGRRVPAADLIDVEIDVASFGAHQPPRDAGRAMESARVRVTHAIRRALAHLAEHHAELNEHLRATIRTGSSCAYLPDPRRPLHWEL